MKGISEFLKKNVTFWFFAIAAVGLMIGSFFVPPKGVIDPSVLTASGIIFAFAALYVAYDAIGRGMDAKVKYGNAEVEITNDDPVTKKPAGELETVNVELDGE